MSPWKSAGLLVVAVLALAACGGTNRAADDATPPESPDPCALVAPTTVAELVGPSFALSIGGYGLPEKTSAGCSWSFGLETKAVDDVRRPQERRLHLDTETRKGDPCTEVKAGKKATEVQGLGDKAVMDLSVKGGVLTFCRDKRLAKITWWAVDWQAGKALSIPDEEYEETLLRLGREVLQRWADAPKVKINDGMPKSTDGPEPPDACDLVNHATLATVGVDLETEHAGGTPSFGSTECTWGLLPTNTGRKAGERFSRHLAVRIQSYGDEWGYRGAEHAAIVARQFSHGWQVVADATLGGGSVVMDDETAVGRASRGAFVVSVELRARNFGSTTAKPDPTEPELTIWARTVLTEVVERMPR